MRDVDRLTPMRWLQPDPALAAFVKLSRVDGSVSPMTADDWHAVWQHVSIEEPVPVEIVRMFEQARACLAYGFFYYPLYALGVEQLLRVADAALGVKCEALGGPNAAARFQKRIDWLAAHGDQPTFERERWHALRTFRNETTHHTQPMLLTPAAVQQLLADIAALITGLFAVGDPASALT